MMSYFWNVKIFWITLTCALLLEWRKARNLKTGALLHLANWKKDEGKIRKSSPMEIMLEKHLILVQQ